MGRKELKKLVLEEHADARCRRTPRGAIGLAAFSVVTGDGGVLGEGHSKVAAWRSAAEAMTSVV